MRLQQLRVRDIQSLTTEHVCELAHTCADTLSHLDMSECVRVSHSAFLDLSVHCTRLETFSIGYQAEVTNLAISVRNGGWYYYFGKKSGGSQLSRIRWPIMPVCWPYLFLLYRNYCKIACTWRTSMWQDVSTCPVMLFSQFSLMNCPFLPHWKLSTSPIWKLRYQPIPLSHCSIDFQPSEKSLLALHTTYQRQTKLLHASMQSGSS